MLQAGDRFRLAAQPRQVARPGIGAGQDHLERHQAIELQVPCLVDDAHAAPAQLGQHLVPGERSRTHRGHGGRIGIGGNRRRRRPAVERCGLDDLVNVEQPAQLRRELGEPPQVFRKPRRLARLLTQQHLVIDQVEHTVRIGVQRRPLGQVHLDRGAVAALPALALIRLQQGNKGGFAHGAAK